MFLGQLPKRLVIGCVDSDALNGTITKIPFDFRHYKINFMALNVDGRQIPAKRYNPTLKTQVIFAVIWDSIPIHVFTGNRIYFDFYTSDGVFTAGLFKSFDVTHSYGRT
jgi:hypothetical protein